MQYIYKLLAVFVTLHKKLDLMKFLHQLLYYFKTNLAYNMVDQAKKTAE